MTKIKLDDVYAHTSLKGNTGLRWLKEDEVQADNVLVDNSL